MFEALDIMQDTFLDRRIGAHRKRKDAAGAGKTPGTLQKRPPERICFRELPERGSFLGGASVFFMNLHVKFPEQIVRENCRHHIKVIAMKPPDGNVIHIALRFQFAERIFLGPASIMKAQDLLHRSLLVRNDHLKLIALLMGYEHIKLNGILRQYLDFVPDKEKPETAVPLLGLPLGIEIRKLAIEAPPAPPALNYPLKLGKPLKGHRYRKLDPLGVERFDDLVAEKGAVHADLDDDAGADSANNADALQNELKGSVGIVDIARAGKHVKDLARLGYRAEQWIIAPLTLLLFVKTDRRAFGHPARAQNRSVEIKRHPDQTEGLNSCKQHLPARLPELQDAFIVNAGQGPAYRRNIGKLLESQKSKRHEVVPVVVHVPEPPVTQHQMHNQYEDNDVMTKDRACIQMIKTGAQPFLQFQLRKQLLNNYQSGKGRKLLVFKPKLRNSVDTGRNFCFTRLHFQWPPGLVDFASHNVNFNQSGGRFCMELR